MTTSRTALGQGSARSRGVSAMVHGAVLVAGLAAAAPASAGEESVSGNAPIFEQPGGYRTPLPPRGYEPPPSRFDDREGEIDIATFYRELAPYGDWFQHPRWGDVWRPNVDADWRPYTRGHWAHTEEHGWLWVAEEEWGWAAFHYGRWVFDEDEEAWLWIPGTEWAPAWVQWRESEDYVGWAPLPPDTYLDSGGLRFSASSYDNPRFAHFWVFVPPRFMVEPGMFRYVQPVGRSRGFWQTTRPVTLQHHYYRGRIYHPGPDWRRVERWYGRPLPTVTIRNVAAPRDYGWRNLGRDPRTVPIYRPRVVSLPPDRRRDVRPTLPQWGAAPRGPDARPSNRPDWRRPTDERPRVDLPRTEPPRGGFWGGRPGDRDDPRRDMERPRDGDRRRQPDPRTPEPRMPDQARPGGMPLPMTRPELRPFEQPPVARPHERQQPAPPVPTARPPTPQPPAAASPPPPPNRTAAPAPSSSPTGERPRRGDPATGPGTPPGEPRRGPREERDRNRP